MASIHDNVLYQRVEKAMYRGVRVSIGKTNRNKFDILDMARRQVDHLGPSGIRSKAEQTNERFSKKGYLRFAPLTAAQIRKLEGRIEELGEPAIQMRPFVNRKRGK